MQYRLRILNYGIFAVGLLPFYLLPVWAGVFDQELQLDGMQLGMLLSADMSAGTVAALLARRWISCAPWRPVLLGSVLVSAAANFACAASDGFTFLLIMRCVAGFAAGSMMAFPYAIFAQSATPDRHFALAMAMQVALGSAALMSAPVLIERWGSGALFIAVGIVTLVPLVLSRASPARNPGGEDLAAVSGQRLELPALFALLAVALFFIALTAIWVVMERLASAEGFDSGVIVALLSWSLLFSFLGSLAPALTVSLAPRRVQVSIAYLLLFLAIGLVSTGPDVWRLAAGLCLYNFFYSFVIPFQSAWVAESDRSGRNAVLVPFAQGVGVSLGPMMSGWAMSGGNYSRVGTASFLILLGSFVLVRILPDPLINNEVSIDGQ